jgi:subtilase family serine protease
LLQGYVCDVTEGNLDVQYITAIARGAPTNWAQVVTSGNTDPFTNLMLMLAQNLARLPLVFSISYGGAETSYGPSLLKLFDQTAQKVALTGRTILAAAGDSGAMDSSCSTGYQPNFPASSSWVTAVGATQGVESGAAETVCMSNYGGTITGGGGFSTYSTLPSWQATQVPSPFPFMPAPLPSSRPCLA